MTNMLPSDATTIKQSSTSLRHSAPVKMVLISRTLDYRSCRRQFSTISRISLLIIVTISGWAIASRTMADAGTKKENSGSGVSSSSNPSEPAHKALLKDATKKPGLITLWQKENKLYAELTGGDYGDEYLILISIARGIGEGWLIGGMSWNDDWVWSFRKINKRVHILRKNVRFRAAQGSPEASAVEHAYTDSVLFSLPIVTKGPGGGDLVDLTPVFMSDLPQISQELPGFSFSPTKSTWAPIKGFPNNVEIEVAATYASSGRRQIDSVADSRGVTVNVHYSISKLPKTGYQPRVADDRIGYFLTVIKDYSNKSNEERFTRYINRWHLEKANHELEQSPPKEHLIFWIENTVPFKYRATIRDGILEWNKAFAKAGFVDAIEVHQQPDNADWNPEDVNYNTIRWMTAQPNPSFSGIGPSRVNPYTGQILDADILINSTLVEFYEYHFETMTPEKSDDESNVLFHGVDPWQGELQVRFVPGSQKSLCGRGHALSQELTFGRTVIASQISGDERKQQVEKLIRQGLKATIMHEVGHTLGLRHNFKGSNYLTLTELNDPDKVQKTGMIASVMDYDPANIVPQGQEQGDYFTPTIGTYDYWAIEYGYKSFSAGDKEALQKIASRSAEAGLAYATDEDTRGSQPDPESGLMDLGNDAIQFAKMRVQLVKESMPGLVERMTNNGDSYAQSRRAFNSLLHQQSMALFHAARYIGGVRISRSHKGDKDAPSPIGFVDVEKQRAALELLHEEVFSAKAYQFPTEIYNLMLSSRWYHWGTVRTDRPDYPVHNGIAYWQVYVLDRLISSDTLSRLHDHEYKISAEKDTMTTAELIDRLTQSIFSEVKNLEPKEYTNRQPAIGSLRRNLQRIYLRRLSRIALGRTSVPEDCQTIAYAQLIDLADHMEKLLNSNITLDSYTRAHLLESANRIRKVVDARITLAFP